jgi:restriction system protein
MAFPTYDQMIEPLLRALAGAPDGLAAKAAHEQIAERLTLGDEAKAIMIPSGQQSLLANRAGWAHDRLKRAELSSSPKRGWWQLTPKGIAFVRQHPRPLTPKEIKALAVIPRPTHDEDEGDDAAVGADATHGAVATASPSDLIDRALAEIRDSVRRDLIERIMNASPAFFETLVLDLLHAMGYGTSRDDLQRVGGSGDGGIDGIISLDRLGLEKVYVQAKRWSSKVGSPEIQTFMGALQLQHASKGVFMTTSVFTRDAIETASRARGTIVLVDGQRLAGLMIDHGVGVQPRALNVPRLDQDYFDED